MKKLLTILSISFVLAACSSGSSVSETPPNITGTWTGTFSNSAGSDSGTITLNLTQIVDSLTVTGIAIILDSDCLTNGSVSGTVNGFKTTLNVTQATDPVSNLQMELTIDGNNTMSGNYVTDAAGNGGCSTGSGAGTVQLSL